MVLFPPPFYFVFDISNSYRTYKIISSYELARPVMGTIFLVLLVGVFSELCVIHPLVDAWVALGTGTDSAASIPFGIPSVQNQELLQCFMHLLAAILHLPLIPLNMWIIILNTFKDLKEWLLSCMIERPL